MIPFEDWNAVDTPGLRRSTMPRQFEWSFNKFERGMEGKRLKSPQALVSGDKIAIKDMEMMYGGRYWAIVGGGIIALPYDSEEFNFSEWAES